MKKAQAFTEYIIAFFIFMAVVVLLFTAFFGRNQPEAQKITEQSSSMLAQALARIAFETSGESNAGSADWQSNCNSTTAANTKQIGLATQGHSFLVPASKLDCYSGISPVSTSSLFLGSAGGDVRTAYFMSIIPAHVGPSGCSNAYTTTPEAFSGICNRMSVGAMYFSFGNTLRSAELRMKVFFPNATITIVNNAFEANDSINSTIVDGGMDLDVDAFVTTTDRDRFQVTFPSADMAYIKSFSYKYSGGANVGNFTLSNATDFYDRQLESSETTATSTPATTFFAPENKKYGESRRYILINGTDGLLYPALISLRTAKSQIVAR